MSGMNRSADLPNRHDHNSQLARDCDTQPWIIVLDVTLVMMQSGEVRRDTRGHHGSDVL